jgi:hypothetical protein
MSLEEFTIALPHPRRNRDLMGIVTTVKGGLQAIDGDAFGLLRVVAGFFDFAN